MSQDPNLGSLLEVQASVRILNEVHGCVAAEKRTVDEIGTSLQYVQDGLVVMLKNLI